MKNTSIYTIISLCKSIIHKYLFSNAELGEDIAEDFVGRDLTGNLAEIEHALADVLGEEIVGDAHLDAFFYAANGVKCFGERLVMPQVGDDHVFLAYGGYRGGLNQ